MAQPGNFTPILLYASSTPTNVPLAANLTNSATGSEIAINVADKNLFFKDSSGAVNTVPIRQSSASFNGWLSSTDWSTFNGKQAALVSGTNIKTVGGVSLLGSGDIGTIGVGYGGTGLTSLTAGYIPFGAGTAAFGNSANLFWNNTDVRLGIGTSSPGEKLHVVGGSVSQYTQVIIEGNSQGSIFLKKTGTNGVFLTAVSDSSFSIAPNGSESARFFASGGVSVGNTTDPGAGNLSVTGQTQQFGSLQQYINTYSGAGGSNIFPSIFGNIPVSGWLYIVETGTTNYATYHAYKANSAASVTLTLISNSVISVNVTNSGGTCNVVGYTTAANVKLKAVIYNVSV